ncbi:14068_t:CDS:2 [Acaulospora morrowiae]|uniref:14068_t:CDS:1 n=1 Tax=Acaulospora morrowiae TaxID=94023 RepID=A0A9N8W596_9GLOM|nr:14068_t:CDS:2 [Acaulospora morrowiae]
MTIIITRIFCFLSSLPDIVQTLSYPFPPTTPESKGNSDARYFCMGLRVRYIFT